MSTSFSETSWINGWLARKLARRDGVLSQAAASPRRSVVCPEAAQISQAGLSSQLDLKMRPQENHQDTHQATIPEPDIETFPKLRDIRIPLTTVVLAGLPAKRQTFLTMDGWIKKGPWRPVCYHCLL